MKNSQPTIYLYVKVWLSIQTSVNTNLKELEILTLMLNCSQEIHRLLMFNKENQVIVGSYAPSPPQPNNSQNMSKTISSKESKKSTTQVSMSLTYVSTENSKKSLSMIIYQLTQLTHPSQLSVTLKTSMKLGSLSQKKPLPKLMVVMPTQTVVSHTKLQKLSLVPQENISTLKIMIQINYGQL